VLPGSSLCSARSAATTFWKCPGRARKGLSRASLRLLRHRQRTGELSPKATGPMKEYLVSSVDPELAYFSEGHQRSTHSSRHAVDLDPEGLRAAMKGKTWNASAARALVDEDPREGHQRLTGGRACRQAAGPDTEGNDAASAPPPGSPRPVVPAGNEEGQSARSASRPRAARRSGRGWRPRRSPGPC
jgi:hypothetical protein